MAVIVQACRYKPDIFRSSNETLVAGLDTSVDPPTGTVILTAQLICYDTTNFDPSNAIPGDPQTEAHVTTLYAEPIHMALESFAGLTDRQALTRWQNALTDFAARMQTNGAADLLQTAIRPARRSPPIVIQ